MAGLNPTSVLNAASDLANAVAELLHAGGDLGDAIPHLKQAMGELPRFTAALERQWPSGGVGPATLPKWTIICTGACIALNTLLMLLHRKEMTLPEDGWTRLVAAAAVPLKLAPMLYGKVVTAAQLDAEVFHNLRLFLEKSAQPLQRLLEMTLVDDPPTMPRRVTKDFAFQQAQTGRPLSLDEMAPLEAPLALLDTALKLVPEPALARSLAQTPELLSQLNRAVAGLQAGIALDAQRGALNHLCLPPNGALAALWPVLASLAPHVPGLQANQRATLLQAVAPLPSPGTPLEYMGLKVAQTLLPKASDAAQQANQQPAAEPAAPEAAAALALRRAHALAVRRGCGNPRCASLAGASEGEARSARCSACRLLRYCGPACNKQDWRWHKLACRALREVGA